MCTTCNDGICTNGCASQTISITPHPIPGAVGDENDYITPQKQSPIDLMDMANLMDVILPLMLDIKEEYRGKGGTGTRECPVCSNTLRFTVIQSNSHTHGRCETDGCVRWME